MGINLEKPNLFSFPKISLKRCAAVANKGATRGSGFLCVCSRFHYPETRCLLLASWRSPEWSRSPGQTGCGTGRRRPRVVSTWERPGGWTELWGCGSRSPAGCGGMDCLWEKCRATGSSFPPARHTRGKFTAFSLQSDAARLERERFKISHQANKSEPFQAKYSEVQSCCNVPTEYMRNMQVLWIIFREYSHYNLLYTNKQYNKSA